VDEMVDKKQTIKRSGQMLLSGWKLLPITCPICTSALFSKGDVMRCPGCDLPVMFENSLTKLSTTLNGAQAVTVTAEEKQAAIVEEPTSFEELKKEYDTKNIDRNLVSSQ
jgi:uncharacterized Zn finger protein (UPF0148 family)